MRASIVVGLVVVHGACSTEHTGVQGADAAANTSQIDASAVVDAMVQPVLCENPTNPAYGALDVQTGGYTEFNTLVYDLTLDEAGNKVRLHIYREAEPFGASQDQSPSIIFNQGPETVCTAGTAACVAFMEPDSDGINGRYELGMGTLTIRLDQTPAPPAAGACGAHDGNQAACDTAGCAYYLCSDKCYPAGVITDLCDGGCWADCGLSGTLTGASFYATDSTCGAAISSLTF